MGIRAYSGGMSHYDNITLYICNICIYIYTHVLALAVALFTAMLGAISDSMHSREVI